MRYAFVGDLPGNMGAFAAILGELAAVRPEIIYCLGDIVGYGAEPGRCIEAIRARGIIDVVGKTPVGYFNEDTRETLLWCRATLEKERLAFLASLPLIFKEEGFCMVHGSLSGPVAFEYVVMPEDANRFFGHLWTSARP